MWYICYDKITDEPRRVIQLATQEKADAIQKYRMSESYAEKPNVTAIPASQPTPKTNKEKALAVLELTDDDLTNIKKIKSIEQKVDALKP